MSKNGTSFKLSTDSISLKWRINTLSANLTKCSNTLKQFVGFGRQIVWVCLTNLWRLAYSTFTARTCYLYHSEIKFIKPLKMKAFSDFHIFEQIHWLLLFFTVLFCGSFGCTTESFESMSRSQPHWSNIKHCLLVDQVTHYLATTFDSKTWPSAILV